MEDRIKRLEQLARLLEIGALTREEFELEKSKILEPAPQTLEIHETRPEISAASEKSHTEIDSSAQSGDEISFSSMTLGETEDHNDPDGELENRGWRRWAKWLAAAIAFLGVVAILAKFGTAIAFVVAIAGIGLHLYARTADEPDFKPFAYVAYGSAIAIYFIGLVLSSLIPRPSQSELAQEQFAANCRDGNQYEQNCQGKFVIWEGVVSSVDDSFVRTTFQGAATIDVWGDVDVPLIEGQRVQVSGYLANRNTIYPDIEDGEISALESVEEVRGRLARIEEAEKAKEARDDARRAAISEAYVGCVAQGYGEMIAQCMQWKGYTPSDYAALSNVMNGNIIR